MPPHHVATSVPLARLIVVLTALGALGCREPMSPDATVPQLAPTHALRTLTGGSATDIFPGSPQSGVRGDARALNSSAQVTGAAIGLSPNAGDGRPYRWSPSSAAVQIVGTSIGTAWGVDINDAGVIAGSTQNGGGGLRAFRAAANAMVILDTLPGTTFADGMTGAAAINASGQIAGFASSGTSAAHAVLWNAANAIQDLGTLGGSSSQAIDINDVGQVIGTSALSGDVVSHFFLWSSSTGMQDITSQVGTATSLIGINNAGQIAGTFTTSGGLNHAFVYTPGSGVVDLGTLGGPSSSPTGLNNKGEVVGTSTLAGGATHAFLWTPTFGMEDITAITGFAKVHNLNDQLQTLTGSANFSTDFTPPRLVQLIATQPNQPPVARFTVACPTLQCSFDASSSTDDAGVVRYAWDWGNGRSESHSYPQSKNTFVAGTYDVTLTVTDAAGLTGSVTKSVTVPTPASNQPPQAHFTSNCTGQQYLHQCSFDASGSADDSGTIVSYTWDWGNGRSETKSSSVTRNTWASSGSYSITLTVKDGTGLTGSTTVVLVVP